MTADRTALWDLKWNDAQARVAARRGNQTEADKHLASIKSILHDHTALAQSMPVFLPDVEGYLTFQRGDYETALARLEKADRNDASVQCLIAQTYERLDRMEEAKQWYRKAAAASAHTAAVAYARPLATERLAALDGPRKTAAATNATPGK